MNPKIIATFLTEDASINNRPLQDLIIENRTLLEKYGRMVIRAKKLKVPVPPLKKPINSQTIYESAKQLHKRLKKKIAQRNKKILSENATRDNQKGGR